MQCRIEPAEQGLDTEDLVSLDNRQEGGFQSQPGLGRIAKGFGGLQQQVEFLMNRFGAVLPGRFAKGTNFVGRQIEQLLAAGDPQQQQAAETVEQVGHEPFQIHAVLKGFAQTGQRRLPVTGEQGASDGLQDVAADQTEHVGRIRGGDSLVGVGEDLVEQAQAVAHRAFRLPDDQGQRRRFEGHPLGIGQGGEVLAQFRGTDPLQFIALATGQDGNRDLVQLGGGEHEIDVGRRLLQGLQQGVEGLGGEHVHLVDDDDLEARRGRHELELVLEVAHLLDAAVGGTVYLV